MDIINGQLSGQTCLLKYCNFILCLSPMKFVWKFCPIDVRISRIRGPMKIWPRDALFSGAGQILIQGNQLKHFRFTRYLLSSFIKKPWREGCEWSKWRYSLKSLIFHKFWTIREISSGKFGFYLTSAKRRVSNQNKKNNKTSVTQIMLF